MALGAGEVVLPTNGEDGEKRIDAGNFSAKSQQVLTQPSYRQAAKRIAESMRNLGGIREAADRIERLASGNRNA